MGNLNRFDQHSPNSLGNVSRTTAHAIEQAAKETGFPVYIINIALDDIGRPIPQDIGLRTAWPHKDHGPFWAAYRRLLQPPASDEPTGDELTLDKEA